MGGRQDQVARKVSSRCSRRAPNTSPGPSWRDPRWPPKVAPGNETRHSFNEYSSRLRLIAGRLRPCVGQRWPNWLAVANFGPDLAMSGPNGPKFGPSGPSSAEGGHCCCPEPGPLLAHIGQRMADFAQNSMRSGRISASGATFRLELGGIGGQLGGSFGRRDRPGYSNVPQSAASTCSAAIPGSLIISAIMLASPGPP